MPVGASSRLGSSVLDLTVDDRAFNTGIKGVVNQTKHVHKAFDVAGVKAEKLSGRVTGLTRSFKIFSGVLGGGALFALTKWTEATINNTIEMKVLASTAGVSTKTFQQYSYAARQAGISQSGLIDGLKELNLRIDEFATTGYGPGAESFIRMGYVQDDFRLKLVNTDDALNSVLETIRRIPDQGARLRIADEVLGGTGGEQFERLITYLDDTGMSMREVRQRAHDMGIVLGDDLVDNTRKVHAAFLELKDVISTRFAQAILNLLPPAEELDKILKHRIPEAVDTVMEKFGEFKAWAESLDITFNKLIRTLNVLLVVWGAIQGAKIGAIAGPKGAAVGALGGAAGMAVLGKSITGLDLLPPELKEWLATYFNVPGEKWFRAAERKAGVRAPIPTGQEGEFKPYAGRGTGETVAEPFRPTPQAPGILGQRQMEMSFERFFDMGALHFWGDLGFAAPFDIPGLTSALMPSPGVDLTTRQLYAQMGLVPEYQYGAMGREHERDPRSYGINMDDLGPSKDMVDMLEGMEALATNQMMGTEQVASTLAGALDMLGPDGMLSFFTTNAGGQFDPARALSGAGNIVGEAMAGGGLEDRFSTFEGALDTAALAVEAFTNPAKAFELIMILLADVFKGMWEILGPLVKAVMKPLSNMLRILGQILAATIVPMFGILGPILKLVASVFQFLYNHVLRHFANMLIGIANFFIEIANIFGAGLDQIAYLGEITGDDLGGFAGSGPEEDDDGDEPGSPRSTFRQQRPIHVYITFPGNVYAVGEGGFRELAGIITEEQKRVGAIPS